MKTALVLFDVDGTLLLTGGASARSIDKAAAAILGPRWRACGFTPGFLDPQIYEELLTACDALDARDQIEAYRRNYLTALETELTQKRDQVRVMPGIRELIESLRRRDDVALGLLTGNWRRAVEIKLEAAGLDFSAFPVGAFAEDGLVRSDLVPVALNRFQQLYGRAIGPRRVVLIGDTARDIEAARVHGCRVLAVATGRYTVEQLAVHKPDVLLADLSNAQALYELLAAL